MIKEQVYSRNPANLQHLGIFRQKNGNSAYLQGLDSFRH